MNPVLAPLWITGLGFLLLGRGAARWRAIGVTFLSLFVLNLAVPTSRPARIAGAYPMLLAAGAVVLAGPRLRRARLGYLAALAVSTAILAPLALPLLSPAALAGYAGALHINPRIENQRMSRVPQWVADRLDWPRLAAAVAEVHHRLPPGEIDGAAFLAGDYGFAGALEHYGAASGITRVIATHNQYFLWGPGDPPPEVVVAFGVPPDDLHRLFASVEEVSVFHCDFCYQDGMPIRVARAPRMSLAAAWPGLRHFE